MAQSGAGEELEPGSYVVAWMPPNFVITVVDPTRAWLGERFDFIGFRPIPDPEWAHPDIGYEDLWIGAVTDFVSYDGESEIEVPKDPGTWLTEHPLLETTEPTAITIDGYEGVQIDAVVTGTHPDFEAHMRFPSWESLVPTGVAMRIIFFEVDHDAVWVILRASEAGFADATAWEDEILAGIDFC